MNDKPLPQALDAEQAVLSTCLAYPEAINEVIGMLTPEMFYLESNKQLFTALSDVCKKTGKSDLISVSDYLKKKGTLENFGGIVGLTKRTGKIVTDSYLISSANLIREKYVLREYIFTSAKLSNLAYVEDLSEVVEFAETSLFNISNFTQNKEPKRIDKLVDAYLKEVESIIKKEKKLSGVPSGFTSIDRITGGWHPSDLIIIAGRPSMGKTALALAFALGTAEMEHPVAIFSLEMSEAQLTGRLLSGVSDYTNTELKTGKVDLMHLAGKSNDVALLPIYIDDTPALSLFELRSKIKKLIVKADIKLAIIDYLQLMKQEAQNREQEVSQISRGLKAIAKEFNIPIVALSQLNRSVEERADKKPRLSDLRESGAIEQDADIVGFIYRPSVYKLDDVMIGNERHDSKMLIVFDIAKNRNGALFTLPLYHNEALTKIKDVKF